MKKRVWITVLCVLLGAALIAAIAFFGKNAAEQRKEGKVTFTFEVVDAEGKTTSFTVTTEKTYVGEALLDEGLIEGEEGPYGLYVKYVNGIRADYDLDGHYWAFYVNGEYGTVGCEQTVAEDGAVYAFKYE